MTNKVDMHTHTSGVSFCSEVSPEQYVKLYAGVGMTQVVLTNHYSIQYMSRYGDNFDAQIQIYLNEYKTAKRLGAKVGLNVLLGAEVAISTPASPYIEFLLYGVTEEFLLQNPCLYSCSQSQLYKICNNNGVLMYQAHPFRAEQGHVPQDPEFMDGTEINCHPLFLRNEDKAREFAYKHNLGLTCGSDFHYPRQAGSAATYIDISVKTPQALATYLKTTPRPEIFYK